MMFQFYCYVTKLCILKQPFDSAQIPWVKNSDRAQWERLVTPPQCLELQLRRLED